MVDMATSLEPPLNNSQELATSSSLLNDSLDCPEWLRQRQNLSYGDEAGPSNQNACRLSPPRLDLAQSSRSVSPTSISPLFTPTVAPYGTLAEQDRSMVWMILPHPHVLPEEFGNPHRLSFTRKVTWNRFKRSVRAIIPTQWNLPSANLHMENCLMDYIAQYRGFPTAKKIAEWWEQVEYTQKIEQRMTVERLRHHLARLLFCSRPRQYFPSRISSSQLEPLRQDLSCLIRDPIYIRDSGGRRRFIGNRLQMPQQMDSPEPAPPISLSSLIDSIPTYPPPEPQEFPDPRTLTQPVTRTTIDDYDNEGYTDINLIRLSQQGTGTAPVMETILKITRPYQEVLELLRMNNDVLTHVSAVPEAGPWDHQSRGVVYINTLGSTFGIPIPLFVIYSTVADLQVAFEDLSAPPLYHHTLPPPSTS